MLFCQQYYYIKDCVVFLLEIAMKDSQIDHVTGLGKKIMGTFSHSWKQRRSVTTIQKELKLPEHQLNTYSSTLHDGDQNRK